MVTAVREQETTGEKPREEGTASRRIPLKREPLLVLSGAAAALLLWWAGTLLLETSFGTDAAPRPSVPPPPRGPWRPPAPATPEERLARARGAAQAGRREEAIRLLEEGLAGTQVEDKGLRARFFGELAALHERLGRKAAARIFRENAARLAREADGSGGLLTLAAETARAGDLRGARRVLHAFLLTSGELGEKGARPVAEARRRLAWSFAAEWRRLLADGGPDRIDEPPLRFEEAR